MSPGDADNNNSVSLDQSFSYSDFPLLTNFNTRKVVEKNQVNMLPGVVVSTLPAVNWPCTLS